MRKRAVGGWLRGEQGCQGCGGGGRGGGWQAKTWTVKYINKQFDQKSSLERFKANRLHQSQPQRRSEGETRQLSKLRNCESKFSGSRVSQIGGKLARKR